jgi:hypothetical protein
MTHVTPRPLPHGPLAALCPTSSRWPLRSWLVGISLLWVALWVQLAVVPASSSRVVACVLFGAAAVDTVAFGWTVQPRRVRRESPGLLLSSGLGVLTLAAVSWTPLVVVGALASIASRSVAPLAVLFFFGLPLALALAIAGYVVVLLLVVVGASSRRAARCSESRRPPRAGA